MIIQVPNINANTLAKHAPVDSVMTTELALKLLDSNHLVVAWDDHKEDETPFYHWGFLSKVRFTSADEHGVKPSYVIQLCDDNMHVYDLSYDHIAPVDDKACPKVFYNDGKSQSVGYLIGLRPSGLDNQDCIILVPPFDKKLLMTVPQSKVTFTDYIKLGLSLALRTHSDEAKEDKNGI